MLVVTSFGMIVTSEQCIAIAWELREMLPSEAEHVSVVHHVPCLL
jgi:hypothetical protein